MRYSGRYAILTAFLAGALILKFNNIDQAYEEVEPFRGASIQTEIWNPLIADSVNQKEISLLVDAKSYTSRDMNVFMDDNLNLMIPVKALRDSFDCSAHIYHGTELLVEKYANEVTFPLNKDEVTVNSEKEEVSSGMRQIDGEYYVPLETLSDSLGYTYSWNMEENSAVTASGKSSDVTIVPASYDLRDKLRAPGVKDQGNHGTCWAFASLTALESSLLPEESYDFSPDHMSIQNSFALNQDYGGDYTMSLAYLLAWQGPVLEEDDPYGDDKSDDSLMPVKHVQEVQIIGSKDFQKIKEAVFKYGGVQTSIYSALKSSQSHSEFYNSKTKAYCYMGQEKPNHDVVIIGWDDNYSKDNFPVDLEGDGAFICQNSWGDDFGDNGIFYVSYYDTNIGIHNVVYTGIEDVDNYDDIYQSDLCGWVGQLGFNSGHIFGANVFSAQKAEDISAAGFYALDTDTEYRVYMVSDFADTASLAERQLVAEGKFGSAGYYTVAFDTPVTVKEGERFAVVVELTTPDSVHPLAIEYAADETTENVDLSDGEGYISAQGNSWENVESGQNCNLCIKAYGRNQQ